MSMKKPKKHTKSAETTAAKAAGAQTGAEGVGAPAAPQTAEGTVKNPGVGAHRTTGRAERLTLAAAIVSVLGAVHRAAALVLVLDLARAIAMRATLGAERCAERVDEALDAFNVLHPAGRVDLSVHCRALCAVWWWTDPTDLPAAAGGRISADCAANAVAHAEVAEEELIMLLNPPDPAQRTGRRRVDVVRAVLLTFEPAQLGNLFGALMNYVAKVREVAAATERKASDADRKRWARELGGLAEKYLDATEHYTGAAALFGAWWPDGPFAHSESVAAGHLGAEVADNICGDLFVALPGLYAGGVTP